MAFSNMSSRERTIVVVLAVIIVVALLGIGVLAARLVSDQDEEPAVVASPVPTDTITPVAPPTPQQPVDTPVAGGAPVAVARAESVGPGAPAIIAAHALHPGRRYRIEIAAANGARIAVNGNWSQSAVATQGQPAAPEIVFFEGQTPYEIAIVSPMPNPQMWSVSVSAGPADILGDTPPLVITIWDVTEAE